MLTRRKGGGKQGDEAFVVKKAILTSLKWITN